MRAAAAAAALVALGGCAGAMPAATACPAGETAAEVGELYFGRNVGGALGVSETDFDRYVAEELAPRFPQGLTLVDTDGRWGAVREPGKLAVIVLPAETHARARLHAAADAYAERFDQEAVLRVVRTACVRF